MAGSLPVLKPREVVALLERLGFVEVRQRRTLTVWFSDRQQEHICEETGDEVVLMKNSGRVIGFEKLNFEIPEADRLRVALETTRA